MNILEDDDFLDFMAAQESQNIIKPSEYVSAVVEDLKFPDQMQGTPLPWQKTEGKFAIRGGEVTVWAGINGHGKSAVLGQVCAHTLRTEKWLIASLEMPIPKTLGRMVKQMTGIGSPAHGYIEKILKWTDDRLWMYDQLDTIPPDRILAMVHYAASKLGITNIIIDSLVKCGIRPDDFNKQKEFVDRLCWAAKRYNIHIHLVHHIRKTEKETRVPDKFDIKGAGEITDLVDNVVIVFRNKEKERKKAAGEHVEELEPDTKLIVAKQRHAGVEPIFNFYFHPETGQFLSGPNVRPLQMRIEQ